jgi:hypothetical protein
MKNIFAKQPDPKEKGDNDNTSHPKKPGNDPDQTPDREVKNPPQADPNQPGSPNQQPKTSSSFRKNFANFFML